MAVNHAFVIKKLQSLEEMFVAYSAVTRMPFATCDEETFNDQIWIFTSLDKLKEFAKGYSDQKILIIGIKVKKEETPLFYMNVYAMGVNEIVFCDGDTQHKLELTQIVRVPDYSKLPEKQRPLINQQLQLSVVYFLQALRKPGVEPKQEELKELEEEMMVNLAKSKFIMPVELVANKGEKTDVRLPYITNKNGQKFQPIFSDTGEYMKHSKNQDPEHKQQLLMVPLEQLPKYMLGDVEGYMVNPEGYNLVLKKTQIERILKHYK